MKQARVFQKTSTNQVVSSKSAKTASNSTYNGISYREMLEDTLLPRQKNNSKNFSQPTRDVKKTIPSVAVSESNHVVTNNRLMTVAEYNEKVLREIREMQQKKGIECDANDDGVVDEQDYELFVKRYFAEMEGKGDSVEVNMKNVDFSEDGTITLEDFATFMTIYYEQQNKVKQILKGDANDDGVVDKKDLDLLQSHLIELGSVKNFNAADMDGDGKITATDVSQLSLMHQKQKETAKEVLKGDANDDGKINQKDLDLVSSRVINADIDGKFVMEAADMNDNGEIDNADVFKVKQLVKEHESSVNTLQGDSNGDGKVNETDHQNIKDYLSHKDSSEDFIMKNSDVNGDGVIDKKDLQGVRNILDGRKIDWDESKRLLGDVNGDGKIDMEDAVTILHHVNKIEGYADRKDFYWDNADVNHDGKIDLADADRIKKFFNREIPSIDYEAPSEPSILGDVNGDGVVDVVNDEVLLNMYLDGEDIGNQPIHLNVADVNEDGVINKDDVQAIDNIFHGRPIDWKPDPVPPLNPINYPQEREIAGYAIWTYTDKNLSVHQGNDVVTVGQKVLVLDETENVVHIQYTNVKGELLDRYIPAKPPAYQSWTAQVLVYKEALQDDGLQHNGEAVFQNELVTVVNESVDCYQVKYWSNAINGYKIRWITKTDVIPYEQNNSPIPSNKPEHISYKGIEMIKGFEANDINKYLTAYILPGENEYTIGYGHKSSDIKKGMTITLEQAEAYLRQDLIDAEDYVKKYCSHLNLNQNQFDALVSFTFNCGPENLQKLLHGESGKENRPLEELPEHMVWYRLDATKQVSPGLVRRRATEVELFNTPVDYVPPTPNPVTEVEPPFKSGRVTFRAEVYGDFYLKDKVNADEKVFAGETVRVTGMSSDGKALKIVYSSVYGGEKERWISADAIEEVKVPEISQKLQDLIDYWTRKGEWSNGDWSGYKKGVAGLKDRPCECKEFASMIFSELFLGGKGYLNGGYIGGGSSSKNYSNWRINVIPKNVYQVNEVPQGKGNAKNFKNLFAQAQSGDFVQIKRVGGGAHSAIVTAVTDEGVWFLEANAPDPDGRNYEYNKIKHQFHKWSDLERQNIAMSIYRAK